MTQWITGEMTAKKVIQVSWHNGAGEHASLITKIRYLSDFSKAQIHIMDPNYLTPQLLKLNQINKMFSLWK